MFSIRKLHGLLTLPPRRWKGMALVVVRAISLEFWLRREPIHRTANRFGVSLADEPLHYGPPESLSMSTLELEGIDDVRRVISRRPFVGTCLRQAILVGKALETRSPRLQIGVQKNASSVTAHAWLVVNSVVVDDYRVRSGAAKQLQVMPLGSGALPRAKGQVP